MLPRLSGVAHDCAQHGQHLLLLSHRSLLPCCCCPQEKGADIYRSKGILNVAGTDDKFVFHGALDRLLTRTQRRQNQLCASQQRTSPRSSPVAAFWACSPCHPRRPSPLQACT